MFCFIGIIQAYELQILLLQSFICSQELSVGEVVIGNASNFDDDEVHEESGEDIVIDGDAVADSLPQSTSAQKKEIKCLKCGKEFSAVSSLKRHVSNYHMPGQNNQCTICDKGGENKFSIIFNCTLG